MQNPVPGAIPQAALRQRIHDAFRADEDVLAEALIREARFGPAERAAIAKRARPLLEHLRAAAHHASGIDAFLRTYSLSSREGIALLCLAEALLRVPDAETADRLIRDKLAGGDWAGHRGASPSLFVNATTWGLLLTGRILRLDQPEHALGAELKRLAGRMGEPLVRQAALAAMGVLAHQFVLGQDIAEALRRARPAEAKGYRHSYDMLGEAARTAADAERFFEAYASAISALGQEADGRAVFEAPSLSVKLSALHPRYEVRHVDRVQGELLPALRALARRARSAGIGFTIDAEEADRLEMSLDLFQALALDPELADWNGLGLAVQAYQKRARPLLDWLADLARRGGRRLMVRLVKGAYWDSEIKLAQERGLADYPVFTRKLATDVSYLACAKRLLADPAAFRPAFATHNAHTLAAVAEIAAAFGNPDWEFQRLHGMGEALYEEVVGDTHGKRPCRVYAPVGSHQDLLAYLVRRMLENGANTSFVSRVADSSRSVDSLLACPAEALAALPGKRAPRIPLPRDLYRSGLPTGSGRTNSLGLDLDDRADLDALAAALETSRRTPTLALPLIAGQARAEGPRTAIRNPANRGEVVGEVRWSRPEDVPAAMAGAAHAQPDWDATPAALRATALETAADAMEARLPALAALIVREAGRTQGAAVAEVREAVDALRYYAAQAREKFAHPLELPGPTGERNTLGLHGRGVFVCISPWNFPLAIFTGQVAAALAAGNAVVAKPAEQTPLVAATAVQLLHEAGIPGPVLNLLPGDGGVGAALVAHPACAGVAFTGSTEVARSIARTLAARSGPIVPLIAETGGQNALIADSSALPEQLVRDAIVSAFDSAGQRCSALRVLFVQADIAERVIAMLAGAMRELRLGDPSDIRTDVGPLIDEDARARLEAHAARLAGFASPIATVCGPQGEPAPDGSYFAPRAVEIDGLHRLEGEVFGPILHVIRWRAEDLDRVCAQIAATGYALTLGIHSRIDATVARILERLKVGNTYVNRNIIGAVVGCQPFGGEGLSGTGPKAGGPHYLYRFALERSLCVDTTAAGGNASLLAEDD